ncbi:MAG: ABC transporter ATP-binding protein [Bryobacter sp.]|nr:ABC transporter ATP-binding protein [Bryobacter sp.]
MISIQNVSKVYQGSPWAAWKRTAVPPAAKWALRNINLDVHTGECFGLVGPNGSGKSTLLEILSGILEPTEGRVLTKGRIAALLELGAGFNPEFTGRENVRLNAELFGLTPSEITATLPQIEAFAGIGDFFDRPVREYSTGMYVRLAFAAAIHQSPDILIVDEALAVGDVRFANQCIRRLEEMRQAGTTILFVSHDLGLVKRLCHRAALLWGGELALVGEAKHVADEYVRRAQPEALDVPSAHLSQALPPRAPAWFASLHLNRPTLEHGETLEIFARCVARRDIPKLQFGLLLRNRQGIEIAGTNTTVERQPLGPFTVGQAFQLRAGFPCPFTRGDYTITLALQDEHGAPLDWRDDCLSFSVIDPRDHAGHTVLDVTFESKTADSPEPETPHAS